MFVVGVTGGIGSGKSTVTNFFAELGTTIIDADIIAKNLVSPGSQTLVDIVDHFGRGLLLENGYLNRGKLRNIIFSNPQAKTWLETLLHPQVRAKILQEIENSPSAYTIVSAPLMIEAGLDQIVDLVLVVDIPESDQLERTALRDNISNDQIEEIIRSQVSRELRLQKADDIVDNSGSLEDTKKQVEQLHNLYLTLAANKPES